MKKKKKRKLRWNNIILFILILIFLTILIISSINIIKWLKDSNNTNDKINNVQENTEIKEVEDSKSTEIISHEDINKNDPYWNYIKMNLIDVDFNELKEKNSDTVGWIQVNGTNVNYPFVQTDNNDYYLSHTYDKSYNKAGWVFMDYRNDKNNFNKNTILYAHGRMDNTMFGSLRKIITNKWLKNKNNYIVKLSTEKENTLWQVFSVYKIFTTNDYIQVNFNSNEKFLEFGNMLLKRSIHNFNTSINENDKIISLSTCYDDDYKIVLHAKLIKVEKK